MQLQSWLVMWSPTGQPLVEAIASTATNARKACPRPYNKYKGEVYAIPRTQYEREVGKLRRHLDKVTLY